MARESGRGRSKGSEQRREAGSLWEQVKSSMAEWYGVAAEKTEEMARIGVRKYDQLTINRTIERAFMDLGAHVYGALLLGQTDFGQDPKVALAVARLRDLEEQLARKEREIAEIRASYEPKLEPRTGLDAATTAQTPVPPEPPLDEAFAELDLLTPAAPPSRRSEGDHEPAAPAGGPGRDGGRDAERTPPMLDGWEDELSLWDESGGDPADGEEKA